MTLDQAALSRAANEARVERTDVLKRQPGVFERRNSGDVVHVAAADIVLAEPVDAHADDVHVPLHGHDAASSRRNAMVQSSSPFSARSTVRVTRRTRWPISQSPILPSSGA